MCCCHCWYHNRVGQDTFGHVCTWGSAGCFHSSAFYFLEHTKTIQGSFWCLGKSVGQILSLLLKQKVVESSQAYANICANLGLIHANSYTMPMGQWAPALLSAPQLSVVSPCPNKPSWAGPGVTTGWWCPGEAAATWQVLGQGRWSGQQVGKPRCTAAA